MTLRGTMVINKISKDEWEIVKARIEAMPENLRISIGGAGALDKDQLLERIGARDEVGAVVVKAQMAFLRSFKGK